MDEGYLKGKQNDFYSRLKDQLQLGSDGDEGTYEPYDRPRKKGRSVDPYNAATSNERSDYGQGRTGAQDSRWKSRGWEPQANKSNPNTANLKVKKVKVKDKELA